MENLPLTEREWGAIKEILEGFSEGDYQFADGYGILNYSTGNYDEIDLRELNPDPSEIRQYLSLDDQGQICETFLELLKENI